MQIDFNNTMKNKTDYLDIEEIVSMLNWCLDRERIRDYMLIQTLFHSGRRISEILGNKPYTRNSGLRPMDIRFNDGLIEFDILKKAHIHTKTKKGSLISLDKLNELRIKKMPKRKLLPVDRDYLALLKDYIQREGILPHQRIFPITRWRADKIIKAVALGCNIKRPNKKIHCHSFRHSLAIHILKTNPNNPSALLHVQYMLDHSSINVTQAYAQFTPEDVRKTLQKTFDKGEDDEITI